MPKNANFSDDYIQQHKGKFEVDIPEVQELANILIAISKIGQLDSNMVDMTTPYHASVLSSFLKYRNHPIIDTINKNIIASDQNSYWYYYALKMNACGYVFDKDDHIINKVIVRKMGFNYPDDPFIKNKKLIEDFARQSKFREFYKNNKTYYDSLIVFYRQINPIDNMQKWLEKKFNFSYGNYCVLFSPLVGGAHATTQFSDNNFDQTFMFVCRAEKDSKYNMEMNEMLNSKVVFTEIDHNFVNPISDKNLESINKVFSKRSAWVKEGGGTEAYSTPYTVFNEYMTWSVFSLYCFDNFPEKDAKQFISKMENQMIVSRGFRQFKSFNQQLIKIYKDEPNITISELYREILNWSSEQNQ